jgi:hypothetical protein
MKGFVPRVNQSQTKKNNNIIIIIIIIIIRIIIIIKSLASHRCGPGFEPGSGHVGFCGGQSGAGASFLRVLRFPLPIFIPPIGPKSSSSIIWGLYNRPKWPQYLGT